MKDVKDMSEAEIRYRVEVIRRVRAAMEKGMAVQELTGSPTVDVEGSVSDWAIIIEELQAAREEL